MSIELPVECPFNPKCPRVEISSGGEMTITSGSPTVKEALAASKTDFELSEDCMQQNLGECGMFRLLKELATKDHVEKSFRKQLNSRNN